MNIKTTVITILLSLALCVSGFAAGNQNKAKNKNSAKVQTAAKKGQGFEQLNLTAQQKKQMQKIMKDYRTSATEINKSTAKESEKATRIKQLRKDTTDKVKAVLTAQQFEKAKKSGVMSRIFGANDSAIRIARNIQKLDLTEAQKTKIQAIVQDQLKQTKAIRDDSTLTKEQRLEKIKPIREASQKKIMELLTPEQKAKLKEISKDRPTTRKKPDSGV